LREVTCETFAAREELGDIQRNTGADQLRERMHETNDAATTPVNGDGCVRPVSEDSTD
jgi:hypothetical protein